MNDLRRAIEASTAVQDVVARVVASGWWLQGPETAAWEEDLSVYVGTEFAVGVSSGTDALEIAIKSAVEVGKAVVTAANCGGYSTTAALRAGYAVRYADVDEESHLLTAETLQPVLDETVGAVIVTHLYGRAAQVEEIVRLCHSMNIVVIEDCAQAIGALVADGRRVGSVGDIAAFSFYPTKNLGALGDAGAVATNSLELVTRVRQLRQYGWTAKYEIGIPGGRNSRVDEIQAAVLRTKLSGLEHANSKRRSILERYEAAASKRIRVLPATGVQHVGHLAVVEVGDPSDLRDHLERAGISSDIHYPIPDHKQPALRSMYTSVSLPVTEKAARSILSVPLFPEMTEEEISSVCTALSTY